MIIDSTHDYAIENDCKVQSSGWSRNGSVLFRFRICNISIIINRINYRKKTHMLSIKILRGGAVITTYI
jgi:hypothetical protein